MVCVAKDGGGFGVMGLIWGLFFRCVDGEGELDGEVELDAHGFAVEFAGNPSWHEVDYALDLFAAAAADVAEDAGAGDGAVGFDGEGDVDGAVDVVLQCPLGVLDVFIDPSVEGVHAAGELGVVFHDGEYVVVLAVRQFAID